MEIQNPDSNNPELKNNQKKGRLIVLAMTVFFLVPIVVVILMYKFNWKPSAGYSRGELVTPARLIAMPAALKNSENQPVGADFWIDKWSIVYVADKCEQICENKLHDIRQIHVSLYKDAPRAQRVFITTQNDVAKYKAMYPELIMINQPKTEVADLSKQFNIAGEAALQANRIYLVDPLGHIMMSYPSTAAPANIRKDVSQLLRYSWAG